MAKLRVSPGAAVLMLRTTAIVMIVAGFLLMIINLYGLTQSIRKPGLGLGDHDQLRFVPEEVWSYQESLRAISALKVEGSVDDFAEKANRVVNQSLVHVDWNRVDPHEYRQLVPIWENYFLWAIGKFSGLPQFERYHYANYERNIKRGIGICGDASTILSSIMDKHGVSNRIVSFQGHVIVEYQNESGVHKLIDPDFGVNLGRDLESLKSSPGSAAKVYLDAGYSAREAMELAEIYGTDYSIFDSTYHFMTSRYIFEKASYLAKWAAPVFLWAVGVGLFLFARRRTHRL